MIRKKWLPSPWIGVRGADTMSVAQKTRPARKLTTETARQLFLYGEGDGVRIVEVKELAKKSGANEQTIRMRLPEWHAELEEILRASTKLASPNILSLPEEILGKHREDIEFLRERLEKSKRELKALPSLISDLQSLVRDCAGDPAQIDTMMQLFDRYLRTHANEKSLTKLFLDLKAVWDAKSGIDSLKSIQEATGKAASIAALKSEAVETPKESGVVSVFKKRS